MYHETIIKFFTNNCKNKKLILIFIFIHNKDYEHIKTILFIIIIINSSKKLNFWVSLYKNLVFLSTRLFKKNSYH